MMRSEDEEENDYEEDEEDEESMRDDAGKDEYDDDQIEGDVDVDGEEEEEDGDDDEGEDGDGEDDEEEDDEDDDDDDDEEEDGDDDEDGGGDDDDAETADAAGETTVDGSQRPSSKAASPAGERTRQPTPPHLTRRSMFVPAQPWPPSSLTIEAVVGIPLPSAVHSIATSTCLSYLLTGGQDGHVRVYDFWASVNGGQVMTAQQRAVVGLGEGVHKAGVGRGWWSCEVEDNSTPPVKRVEPVYSLACEGDALWALAGSQSGPINLYSLRHKPGHLVHSLRGHTNVVSCLQLLPGEKGLLSGSWDGAVKEWDLNTGQVVRSYPTHGAQISSLSLRPITSGTDKEPERQGANGDALPHVSVSVGPEFFKADREKSAGADGAGAGDGQRDADGDVAMTDAAGEGNAEEEKKGDEPGKGVDGEAPADADASADVEMAEAEAKPADAGATANGGGPDAGGDDGGDDDDADSLFDDDGGGEDEAKDAGSPAAAAAALGLGLALPGATGTSGGESTPAPGPSGPTASTSASGPSKPATTTGGSSGFTAPPRPSAAKAAGAASTIPLLSPAEYKAMSNDIMLTSSMDGQVTLFDRREGGRVGRLIASERAPPWCMSAVWLGDGNQVLAGRRNGTVDIWDVRKTSSTATSLLRTLRTPADSGPISCIVAFPDGQHVATASTDNIRLWNTAEYYDPAAAEETRKRSSRPPFRIIAGHHGGTVSSMIVDPTSRFLISASGDRGWQGESTKVVLIHEVKW